MHQNLSFRTHPWLFLVPFLPLIGLLADCTGSEAATKEPAAARDGLMLSGAFFKKDAATGKSMPLPARTLIARPPQAEGQPWSVELLECGDKSNVFHKAIAFKPVNGKPGILTISAAKAGEAPAQLKLWRKNGSAWEGELIYSGVFGGKFDRLRDVEVGDVNGDKVEDIVVVSHQRGVTVVIEQKDGKYVTTQVAGAIGPDAKPVWIHEVEIGDVDGDGINEFFTTPSEPNNLDGKVQPGELMMYKFAGGKYVETRIEQFTTRHAKEILCYDFEKSGKPLLFVSMEGEAIGGEGGATTMIRCFRWTDGKMVGEDVLPLPGKLCRFLVGADTDGDGSREIVAATAKDGIYCLFKKDGAWKKRTIVDGATSSGFEHATTAFDWDGDGKDDVFAVSDDQKVLRRYTFDAGNGTYKMEKVLDIPADSMFVFNLERLPAGM